MALSGTSEKRLHHAILSGFSRSDLERLVWFELNERLENITRPGPLNDVVFDLIHWAEKNGRTEELLRAIQRAQPDNEEMQAIAAWLLSPARDGAPEPGTAPLEGALRLGLDPQHDPAVFLQAVAADMARAPFPWSMPREGIEFFHDLHVKVRVGPRRRDALGDREQERLLSAGAAVSRQARLAAESAYRPAADEARFPKQPASPPRPWFEPKVQAQSAREQFPWAVALGDPGLGKTTLLRYEGWLTAREGLATIQEAPDRDAELLVPIFVRLAQLVPVAGQSEGDDAITKVLVSAAADAASGCGYDRENLDRWLTRKLQAGQVVLLLDALDELTDEEDDALDKRLEAWVRKHPPRRLYLTSRQAGYRGLPAVLKGRAEPELELVAFTADEVRGYVKAYFGPDPRGTALRKQLDAHPGIFGLAQIPLFAALICLVFSEGPAGDLTALPDTRSGLIARCLDVLLLRWDRVSQGRRDGVSVIGDASTLRTARDWLAELARDLVRGGLEHAGFGDPERTLFHEVLVGAAIDRTTKHAKHNPFRPDAQADTRAVIGALAREIGVLTLTGRPPHARYLFLHRTFQEYLLAWSIARQGDWREHISALVYDAAWHEPFAMLGGAWEQMAREGGSGRDIAADARSCIEWLLQENARDLLGRPFLLACDIVAEGRAVLPAGLAQGVTDVLVECLARSKWDTLLFTDDRFGQLRRQGLAAVDRLVSAFWKREYHDPILSTPFFAVLALEALGRSDPPVIEALLAALRSDGSVVRRCAARALGALGCAETPIVEALKSALTDQNSVRFEVAKALAALGCADPPVIDTLLTAVLHDQDHLACARLAGALWELGRLDLPVADRLRSALGDKDFDVRRGAAEVLGALGQVDASWTDALLAALRDTNERVCGSAAKALVVLGHRDLVVSRALPDLRDQDAHVRQGAAEALRAVGRPEKAITDALRNALRDESWWVRESAAHALGTLGWADESLLGDLVAMSRDDRDCRESALRALGVLGQPSAQVLDAVLLQMGAYHDHTRSVAARALGDLCTADARVMRDARVIDALLAALDDKTWWALPVTYDYNESVQISAATALGALDVPEARVIAALLHGLSCYDARVGASIREALWNIGIQTKSRVPAEQAHWGVRKLHEAWNQQLLSLVSAPSVPWWQFWS
jgi:HEAT repeat protein